MPAENRTPNEIVNELRRNGLSIDTPNQYKQDLIDAICGAIAFGYQNTNPPPTDHWGKQFWDMGRAEGERAEGQQREVERYRNMFNAAVYSLAEIDRALGITEETHAVGGAGAALAEIKKLQDAQAGKGIIINGYQLREAMEFLAPDNLPEQLDGELYLLYGGTEFEDGPGLFAYHAEYPEEGCCKLVGAAEEEQPSAGDPEVKTCWSADEETFNDDNLEDLLSSNDHLKAGDTVWFGQAQHPDPGSYIDASDVIEMIGERGYDDGGDFADDYPQVSDEAKAELDASLKVWATQHCQPSFYLIKNIQPYVLTEDDIASAEREGDA